jgi:amino acid transporter
MARDPQHRLEDWMRLILQSWVLISMVMFYSILMGIALGSLVLGFSAAAIQWIGLPAHFLRLFPSPGPAGVLVIGGLIAAFFLHLFRNLRYNCESGGYTLATARVVNLRTAAGFAGLALLLVLIGAVIARISPP